MRNTGNPLMARTDKKEARLTVLKYVFGVLVFCIGLSIFLYPAIAGLINERTQTRIVQQFEQAVEEMSSAEKAKSVEEAKSYNEALVQNQGVLEDPFEASLGLEVRVVSMLNVGDVMGYVEIPKIGSKLPIYEGTTEVVLQTGIGWLKGTSLPVGGASTNTILTGHRGLPNNKLFTDIDKLEIGDEFYIRNVAGILAYRVVEVRIIEPNDVSGLAIIEGKDMATLLTCHPLSINSHRLLVIGERIPYIGQLDVSAQPSGNIIENLTPAEKDFTVALLISLAASNLLILWLWRSRRKARRERAENDQEQEI